MKCKSHYAVILLMTLCIMIAGTGYSQQAPDLSNTLYLEAENANPRKPFLIYEDADATNGKYVTTPPAHVLYPFQVDKKGDYEIWYRAINPLKGAAFFFYIDDEGRHMGNDRTNPDVWYWKKLINRRSGEIVRFAIDAGDHVMKIQCPEGHINIDAYFLTTDTTFTQEAPIMSDAQKKRGIWIEAESGNTEGLFEVVEDAEFNGGKYLTIPHHPLVFDFNIKKAGVYKFYGRVIAPIGNDDSFYFKIDDGKWITWNNIHHGDTWHFVPLFDSENESKIIEMQLTRGKHTLLIKEREDMTKLDGVLITDQIQTEPQETWIK